MPVHIAIIPDYRQQLKKLYTILILFYSYTAEDFQSPIKRLEFRENYHESGNFCVMLLRQNVFQLLQEFLLN